MRQVCLAVVLSACACLAACGDEEDKGFPPSITNLSFTPATAAAGGAITVNGTVEFTDREGDVDSFSAAVNTPAGSATVGPTNVNASGQTAGTIGFQLLLNAPTAGTYSFQLWLEDEQGNESNRLGGDIEVN